MCITINGNGPKGMLQIDVPPCRKFLVTPLIGPVVVGNVGDCLVHFLRLLPMCWPGAQSA